MLKLRSILLVPGLFAVVAVAACCVLPRSASRHWCQLLERPDLLLLAWASYTAGFWLRAAAWSLFATPSPGVARFFHYHMVGLLANHLLPTKVGDALRVWLSRSHAASWRDAILTVTATRVMDVGALCLLLIVTGWSLVRDLPRLPLLAGLGGCLGLLCVAFLLNRSRRDAAPLARQWRMRGGLLAPLPRDFTGRRVLWASLLTIAGWVCEAAVISVVALGCGIPLTFREAVFLSALTVLGQVLPLTPGGVGTYEAALCLGFALLGHSVAVSLPIALLAHGWKFVYAYTMGALSLWALFGRAKGRAALAELPVLPRFNRVWLGRLASPLLNQLTKGVTATAP